MRTKLVLCLTTLLSFTAVGTVLAVSKQSHVVCSEDVIPDDMVVTATGTSPLCKGSCRARRIEPIRGPIMIICANQAVPKDYSLDSVTSTPDCQCLGNEDNAYVVKKLETPEGAEESDMLATPTATPTSMATPGPEPLPEFRTGE